MSDMDSPPTAAVSGGLMASFQPIDNSARTFGRRAGSKLGHDQIPLA
jgi:hypothetical protein